MNVPLRLDVEMDDVFSLFVFIKLKDMANGAGLLDMSIPFGLLMAIDPRIRVIRGKLSFRGDKIRIVEKFSRMLQRKLHNRAPRMTHNILPFTW